MFPDVFRPDLFTMQALTAAVNEMPYVPGRLKELGLFEENGVATTSIVIEKKGSTLSLVSTKHRGAAGQTQADDKRTGIAIEIPHLPQNDTLMADSVQGVREFGSEAALRTVTAARDEKLEKMQRNLEYTHEYHRLGAIQGKIYDADGTTVILDLFTAFGVAEPTEVDFDLDNGSPAPGAIRLKCNAIHRAMSTALGAQPYSGIYAPCGDTFFDQLTQSAEVRETFLQQQEASELRNDHGVPYQQFRYGGIVFENYRGAGAVAVGDTKCRFVPLGVPGLCITRYAPANYMDAVNTVGLPFYSSAHPLPHGKGVDLEVQSNPIHICTRPQVLLRARNT